jgi:hypothetical protein
VQKGRSELVYTHRGGWHMQLKKAFEGLLRAGLGSVLVALVQKRRSGAEVSVWCCSIQRPRSPSSWSCGGRVASVELDVSVGFFEVVFY